MVYKVKSMTYTIIMIAVFSIMAATEVWAGTPGLPFTEDFDNADLKDWNKTNANWSSEEQHLAMAWRQVRYGAFGTSITSATEISPDNDVTESVVLGDVDGDGDLDLIVGDLHEVNMLYLNNGTDNPWEGVSGKAVSPAAGITLSLALGDVDNDGDLDLIEGNYEQTNKLFLNNGTDDPWFGVDGIDITSATHNTYAVVLGDIDNDGDLDLVEGNSDQLNCYYINNGTSNPWDENSVQYFIVDASATFSIALGDVDNDGDLDMVAGNYGERNRVFLNKGGTNPWFLVQGKDISTQTNNTDSVVLGDVDGDGDLDLVEGNYNQRNKVYWNNGTSNPWSSGVWNNISLDSYDTWEVVLGDVDGDGDLDMISGESNRPNRLYLNDGSSVPWDSVVGTEITADDQVTTSIVLGDVDGDGDLDLVEGNSGESNRLYINNLVGDPWLDVIGENISTDYNYTYSLALGDVDGDGDLDLVSGNVGLNRLYQSDGIGNPWDGAIKSNINTDGTNTRSIALGDIDNDGDLDLVEGNFDQADKLYLNTGSIDPWLGVTASNITSNTLNTTSIALGDVDNDGDLDVVTGSYNQVNRVYINDVTGMPNYRIWIAKDITDDVSATNSIALGDVDNDGDLDLVVGNFDQPNVLYKNNGTDDPWYRARKYEIPSNANKTYSVALGDVNNDGKLDLVVGNYGQSNQVFLNNGTNNPFDGVKGINISNDADCTRSVALGDIDNDGDLDMIAGNVGSGTEPRDGDFNRLYINNGTENPWEDVVGLDISSEYKITYSVVLGDIDNDGDLDLITGNYEYALDSAGYYTYYPEINCSYLNNSFNNPWIGVEGTNLTEETWSSYSIALGDVDNDGDLDLFEGNMGQTNKLYLNNGTLYPWNGSAGIDITTDVYDTRVIAVGDVDNDGDLDMIAGNEDQPNRLYLNIGGGDPWDPIWFASDITADASDTNSLALGDVDNDGDLDLVVGNYSQSNVLYRNNGTPDPWVGAAGEIITTNATITSTLALGDVGGDGSLDLIVAGMFDTSPKMKQTFLSV